VLWSDIPNNCILRWEEETGTVSLFRQPSNFAHGYTRDRQGRLLTCEHGGRRVTRPEYDGTLTVLMDHWHGHRLNSPTDVVVKSDGSIWFTDPIFGILGHYEGHMATPEVGQHVCRLDGATGEARLVADDVRGPSGLCFAPDESILYVVEEVCRSDPSHAHSGSRSDDRLVIPELPRRRLFHTEYAGCMLRESLGLPCPP
jgi:gluconolactonase